MDSEEAELRIWAANSLHTAANRINGELTAGEVFDCKLIRRNFSQVLVILLFDTDFFFSNGAKTRKKSLRIFVLSEQEKKNRLSHKCTLGLVKRVLAKEEAGLERMVLSMMHESLL